MKISMITTSMSRNAGGLFEAVRHLSFALQRQPATCVKVFAGEDEFSTADRNEWQNLDLSICRTRGPRAIGWLPDLMASLHESAPDILHQNGIWMYTSYACCKWAQTTGRPRIIAPHGMLDPWALSVAPLKKRIARLLYEDRNLHGATALHALNLAEHDAMRTFGLKSPIMILPNGVDSNIASGQHSPPPWTGKLPQGARILLFLGRLHPKKGLVPLLRAFALASSPETDDWRLVIGGWDQNGHRQMLESLVDELGLKQQVYFTGPLFGEAKTAALAAADAFILPSFSEGLPMAVLEAWAFSKPALLTRACNLPEGFTAGAAIEITTDPQELADTLKEFARLPTGELFAAGARGRKLVLEHFTWDHVAERMRSVCDWLINGGSVPAEIRQE